MHKPFFLLIIILLAGCQSGNLESRKYNISGTEKRFGEWLRVKNNNPIYPPASYKKKEEGYVTLNFIIDINGMPTDIRAAVSNPPGVFEKAAIEAQMKNRYVFVGKGEPKPSEIYEERYIFVTCMPLCKK